MPRAFAITASTNNITLSDQGRGEVAFTVSNTSGGQLRGRAVVKALDPTQSDWLRVVDESERDFDSQTVHQFTVEVAVPQGTPEGTYSFRLDVVSVEDPDDVFDEGPVIAFEVHEAEVPVSKPFPWWIVAAAAGFVVVVSIAIWIITRPGPVPPTQYTIVASSSGNGTIEPSGTVNVNSGEDQEFTITPSEGFKVADVQVDGKSKKNELKYNGNIAEYPFSNVKKNYTIIAIFIEKDELPYDITIYNNHPERNMQFKLTYPGMDSGWRVVGPGGSANFKEQVPVNSASQMSVTAEIHLLKFGDVRYSWQKTTSFQVEAGTRIYNLNFANEKWSIRRIL